MVNGDDRFDRSAVLRVTIDAATYREVSQLAEEEVAVRRCVGFADDCLMFIRPSFVERCCFNVEWTMARKRTDHCPVVELRRGFELYSDDGRVMSCRRCHIDAGDTRTRLMRWLGNGDYLISGSLQGPIIASEGVTRDGVTLMLSGRNSQLTGGMHTTGSKSGGKQRMVLSVVEITLNRSSE